MARPPRISGRTLEHLARFARSRVGGAIMPRILRADLGVDALDALPESLRGDVPLDTRVHPGRPPRRMESAGLPLPAAGWAPNSAWLTARYESGALSPREVTTKAFAEARRLAALSPSVGPLLDLADGVALIEAEASEARWRAKRPLGPLDGVPWVVKEQMAVRGLPRMGGTTFMDSTGSAADGTAVARLRAAGAITLGTTVMTELGMTTNGANAKRVMPRNPHALDRHAGGSSTGSAVAVAAGLVPFALGADGGGSIRVPASVNGIFGIKPTWGRVSRSGDFSGGTVAHVGPLACGTADLAQALEVMSGHDPNDPQTFGAPPREAGSFVKALGRGVRGLVIGVPDSEWADASEPVQRAGRAALAALEKEGAKLVPLELALAKHATAIGMVIIACESRAALRQDWREHADDMGPDLQVSFAALDAFTAVEYLETARLRSGLRRELARALGEVDLIALPATVTTATKVSDTDMATGYLDTTVLAGLCRYAFAANLSGLPAASVPVGTDADGVPVGLQLLGDAWDEATIFAASAHLERLGIAVPPRPTARATLTS